MPRGIKLYIIFCSIFCTILVTGNLIFQKFVSIPFFTYHLEVSVGVLLYPITFLISDLVTEFFGKNSAIYMIKTAVVCSFIVMFLVLISDYCPATNWSIVDDATFHKVFSVYGIGTTASIIANYFGQKIDILVFAYLKKLTNSKHLWLRNSVSTLIGQTIDSIIVLLILCSFNIFPWEQYFTVAISSLSFKYLSTVASTPICYLGYYLIIKLDLAYMPVKTI